MGHYSHKSKPDAKFDCGIFSSLGLMTSQNFTLNKETSHKKFGHLPQGFNIKIIFLCPDSFFLTPKLTPMSISTIFKPEKIFSFSELLRRLNKRRAAATPLIDQLDRRCLNPIQAGVFWNYISWEGGGGTFLHFSFICCPVTTKLGMVALWYKISQGQ